jgi:hypothetical protein
LANGLKPYHDGLKKLPYSLLPKNQAEFVPFICFFLPNYRKRLRTTAAVKPKVQVLMHALKLEKFGF